ncbi:MULTISPECIES: 4-hydroxyphenylacetate decarboxylase large subunit [unclassified Pseudodesulfovibrio]|uniref:4-hydroxyphenylacetate decarboxylase large subunit n=1 Tax=unclassified Pseudodesulfovibrio TaxID=2661612 RepID=UPI000FEB658A|nr:MULTISPECIES: 4-hydroxyphenylacetate decarboxylase large subunit [unclassified Pseudodesulfovibrio]MCJ2163434.1 4-hydroxyphenylacetate decarboxylase large subunit [Pseudodesulfovibrio sp. S3-i]RWU06671.1 MFS transporter [Pseudodesulfovibrio sp. S3]
MAKTFKEVMADAGISMDFQACGTAPAEIVDREIRIEPHERVQKLKDIFMQTLSSANNEFPYWYTREFMKLDGEIAVVRRAKALKRAFSNTTPVIYPGEKLVMHKAPFFRGSFPMPWLSEGFYVAQEDELYQEAMKRGSASADEHSKFGQGGGNVVASFGKIVSIAGKFGMRQEEIPALIKLSKMWIGKSVDDLGSKYEQMVPNYETKEAIMRSIVCMFDSGYTLPQGREVINYYYPLEYGFDGIIKIAKEMKNKVAGRADGDGLVGTNRLYNYEAVIHVVEGVQNWILNYAKEARRLEAAEKDATLRAEYGEIADCLEWIAHNPPRTFREAFQLIETIHLAVLNEDAISGLSPGRIGQILYPYFEQDMEAGRITEDEVLELLELDRLYKTSIDCFASMGVVGGVLSGNTFNTVSVGGLDKDGKSAVNPLEYLILKAAAANAMPQSTIALLYDEKLPEDFLLLAAEVIKTGAGYPAFMNAPIAHEFLMKQYGPEGMDSEEARAWAIGGCLETSACCWKPLHLNGKEYFIPGGCGQPTSVGVHFVSMPKILELVLTNGVDSRTGERVYKAHDRKLDSYDVIWDQFKLYWQEACDVLALTNNLQHDIWRKNNMAVFQSMLKPDCLDTGHLIDELGYRYNATYNVESTGTITCVNSLAAIKKLVFEDKSVTLEELSKAIANNFGFKTAHEVDSFSIADQQKKEDDTGKWDKLHFMCLQAPKYGNDDPAADSILQEWESFFCPDCSNYESLYGHPMYPCQISVSTHGAMGSATLASADGRLAGTTFADASLSAYPGTDRNGPFALMSSATCWDHAQSQNSQLNIKIHPSAIKGPEGSRKLVDLTRAYMRKGGFHVQYNVVDSKMLRDAQQNPNNYRDLMVRVAGFTQYWVEIGKAVQDELIARTEYEGI